MFWKIHVPHLHRYKYVAVVEIEEVDDSNMLYGEKEFRLTLANGSVVKWPFKPDQYRQWQSGILEGGLVVNP